MTIQNLYTKQRPDIIYNVINGREELPVNAEFSRAGAATYVDANGIIQTAAAGVPRFDHDPETQELSGLLLEKNGINLCEESQDFTATDWNAINCPVTANDSTAPDNTTTANRLNQTSDDGRHYVGKGEGGATGGQIYTVSAYVKNGNCDYCTLLDTGDSQWHNATFDFANEKLEGVNTLDTGFERFSNGWYRIYFTAQRTGGGATYGVGISHSHLPKVNSIASFAGDPARFFYAWGMQIEEDSSKSSYIPTSGSQGTRDADSLALTSPKNFDPGFSMLLDSETTTKDFLYKIKNNDTDASEPDNKKVIAYLKNDGGTLEWWVNGSSAQNAGTYPQVGFQFGRIRTISSFAAAGDTATPNYLYTTGLSFPTVATAGPGAGAEKIQFGTPQTLKALYIWPGQLDATNAVSLIKGQFKVIPPDSFKPGGNEYVFVYNTDPEDAGIKAITLPSIKPSSGSMTIKWGDDGDAEDAYTKDAIDGGLVPSHEYPYPGQYRIQVTAAKGFDSVTLGFGNLERSAQVINRVDQWAPQHRKGAVGGGFKGDEMVDLLLSQADCSEIPDFEYTDLTSLSNAFKGCKRIAANGPNNSSVWSWIPTEAQKVEDLEQTFNSVSYFASDAEKAVFPQLKTSDKLTSMVGTYANSSLIDFVDESNNPSAPVTNSSKVINFNSAFTSTQITTIRGLDLTSAQYLPYTFLNCNKLKWLPQFTTPNLTSLISCFFNCKDLNNVAHAPAGSNGTSILLFDTSQVTQWSSAFYGCESFVSLPSFNTSSGVNFESTFQGCESITNAGFPTNFDFRKGEKFMLAFASMQGLTQFPPFDFDAALDMNQTWYACNNLTSFPSEADGFKTPNVSNFAYAFNACAGLTSFPKINLSSASQVRGMFNKCSSMTNVADDMDWSKVVNAEDCFKSCSVLTNFPCLNFSSSLIFAEGLCRAARQLADVPAGVFDNCTAIRELGAAFDNCRLTAASIENILTSLVATGATDVELGLSSNNAGGATANNADYDDWTDTAKSQYAELVGNRGWDININDAGDNAPFAISAKSGYYINHDENNIAFGQIEEGSTVGSAKPNQESFATEEEALVRLMELDPDYFPAWDRKIPYSGGEIVKFGRCLYRSLKQIDVESFELPSPELGLIFKVSTPANRQERWVQIYEPDPEALEEEPVAAFTVDDQPRRRAHNPDGTFRANDPNTPENEAWE